MNFQFIDNENNLKLVIERKTLNDLSIGSYCYFSIRNLNHLLQV